MHARPISPELVSDAQQTKRLQLNGLNSGQAPGQALKLPKTSKDLGHCNKRPVVRASWWVAYVSLETATTKQVLRQLYTTTANDLLAAMQQSNNASSAAEVAREGAIHNNHRSPGYVA